MKYPAPAALVLVLAFAPAICFAAVPPACSIHPPGHAAAAQLAALSKVAQSTAARTALDAVKQAGKKTIKSAELEAEHGCLIWSFDIGMAGSRLTHEVAIDAGTGAVLSATTETTAQEADEVSRESKSRHGG